MDLIPNNPDVLSDACQGNGPRATEKHPIQFGTCSAKWVKIPPRGSWSSQRGLVQLRLAWGVRGSQEHLAGQKTMLGVRLKRPAANSSTMRGGNDAQASETACQ